MPRFDGHRLRDQRLLSGVPASDLAARIRRSPRTLWAYERGAVRPSVDVALQLADALQVPLDTLLADDLAVA